MQVRQVAAAQGWRWVVGGFRLLAARPLALLALLVFDVFLLLLPSILPLIGPLMPTLLTPVFGVGLMVAMRATDRGGNPAPQMLFAAFGDEGGNAWRNLLILGAFNAIATMAAITLTALADGGSLLGSVTGLEGGEAPAGGPGENGQADDPAGTGLVLPDISLALLFFLLLLVPIQAASWYAPLFIAWHRIPVAKSLFFSLVAVWRNKAAFGVYVASWIAAVFGISTIVTSLTLVTGVTTITSMLVFFASLAILTAMYGSVWLSYRDVIEADTPTDVVPPGELTGE
ncbi:MAG: BPSS1780 family membrane protein [Pseudomonadota bacterium]|nr:BPSS1780 family membrane protein [Pseudomonadota bacterium]